VKFGGLKFLDSAHVKDVLALLRFAQNPRDIVAGFRIMLLVPGAGPATVRRVLAAMTDQPSPIRALGQIPVPPRLGAAWGQLVAVLTDLHHSGLGWPAELERACAWYEPMLEALHEEVETRRADLLTLQQIAGGYASRERFLTELTLDPPDATSDQAGVPLLDEDYLILSTIHSAKGQEWRSVFLLNAVDGCIPSDLGTGSRAEVEEERRLLYVAMTRARERLHILLPQRFFTHAQRAQGDRHVYASRTRFIPREILDCFDYVSWPGAAAARAAVATPAGLRIDVAAQMRGMWR
jgi:DNA helicase-2/ATP-dependent DNA helicase PcrA